MKVRELVTVGVFLVGLSQIPEILAEFLRSGLWFADLRESGHLFSPDYYSLIQFGSVAVSLSKAAIIVSFVLLPNWWAGLVPRAAGSLELPSLSLASVQVTLVSLTGLILVALALSELSGHLIAWYTRRQFDDSVVNLAVSRVTQLPLVVRSFVRLLLGAWMLFGAQGLVDLWKRIRTGEGLRKAG